MPRPGRLLFSVDFRQFATVPAAAGARRAPVCDRRDRAGSSGAPGHRCPSLFAASAPLLPRLAFIRHGNGIRHCRGIPHGIDVEGSEPARRDRENRPEINTAASTNQEIGRACRELVALQGSVARTVKYHRTVRVARGARTVCPAKAALTCAHRPIVRRPGSAVGEADGAAMAAAVKLTQATGHGFAATGSGPCAGASGNRASEVSPGVRCEPAAGAIAPLSPAAPGAAPLRGIS